MNLNPDDSINKTALYFREQMQRRAAIHAKLEAHPDTTLEMMVEVAKRTLAFHAQTRPVWELFKTRCAAKQIILCRYEDLPTASVPLIVEPSANTCLAPSRRLKLKHLATCPL